MVIHENRFWICEVVWAHLSLKMKVEDSSETMVNLYLTIARYIRDDEVVRTSKGKRSESAQDIMMSSGERNDKLSEPTITGNFLIRPITFHYWEKTQYHEVIVSCRVTSSYEGEYVFLRRNFFAVSLSAAITISYNTIREVMTRKLGSDGEKCKHQWEMWRFEHLVLFCGISIGLTSCLYVLW